MICIFFGLCLLFCLVTHDFYCSVFYMLYSVFLLLLLLPFAVYRQETFRKTFRGSSLNETIYTASLVQAEF